MGIVDRLRLHRVFDVLGQLATGGPKTVTELSRQLDLPLSSTHDLLQGLLAADAVSAVGKTYSLGPRTIRLSVAVLDSVGVQRIARHHLEELAARVGLDVYLAVRTGTRILYVVRCAGIQAVNIDIPLGRSLFLHSTAVGKLFAAFQREVYQQMISQPRPALTSRTRTTVEQLDRELAGIRSRGVSISRGESVPGILGMAAPVWGANGELVAAVHVSALQGSLTPELLLGVTAEILQTAQVIETELTRAVHTTV